MTEEVTTPDVGRKARGGLRRAARAVPLAFAVLAIGAAQDGVVPNTAIAQEITAELPPPPANGEMGFVVTTFHPALHLGEDDCPEGPVPTLRETYLDTLDVTERTRLLDKANEPELTRRWQTYATGPNNTNICSQPELFDRPAQKVLLKGRTARGLNLDDDTGDGSANPTSCAHENFTSPSGEAGVDNQVWRVMGCSRTWRGVDGMGGDVVRGYSQFLVSGEWTQVLLLRGVDSLVNDSDVEIIYANSEDRAIVDAKQDFIPGASFTVTDKPQYRNVLRGRIVNGVLTTEPKRVRLKQTWGQSRNRDIRGMRTEFDFRNARLRLAFQPDGSLKGLVGGYQPIWNVIASPSIGGIGAATTAGYDCAGMYAALKKLADGDRDPKTGQCQTISSAMQAAAVPAFVNDRPPSNETAAK